MSGVGGFLHAWQFKGMVDRKVLQVNSKMIHCTSANGLFNLESLVAEPFQDIARQEMM